MTFIVYFQREIDNRYQEVSSETPAKNKEGQLVYLKDCPEWQGPIEVYIGNEWVRGERVSAPTEYRYTLSVMSFDDEKAVGRAVGEALRKLPNTSPWYKISKEEG